MLRRLTFFVVCLLLNAVCAFAQGNVISGTVVSSEDGQPVIGASVMVKGTKTGAATDVDGHFTLNDVDDPHAMIVVSYIGMQTTTVKGDKDMHIKLYPDDNSRQIGEVVVTGIQKMDKRLFTGAATQIDAEKTHLSGIADATRSLEGRVAGLSVENVSNTFGTAPKIRVRGATSIYGSSSPLWVVDGVILEDAVQVNADDLSSGDAATLISNAIAGLNADDIESFQVLKDGSATSIYGARAMAGVVVVTTKKGHAGKSTINYTGEFTYRLKPNYHTYNISDSQEQMGIYKEMEAKGWLEMANVINNSTSGLYGQMYKLIDTYNSSTGTYDLPYMQSYMNEYLQKAELRNTDWFDLLFNSNIMQNHSVSVSTGSDKANVYASLSALNDPGWYKDSKVERYTANVNAGFKVSKWVSINLRSNASHRDQKAPGTLNQNIDPVGGSVSRNFDINPFSYALNTARTLDPDAEYTRNYAPFNIFRELDTNYINVTTNDFKLQGDITWKPVKGLEIVALGAYRTYSASQEHVVKNQSNQAEAYRAGVDNPNVMYNNTFLYQDPDKPNSLPISVMPTGGINILNENSVKQLDFRGTISYNNMWKDTHILNAMIGMEANRADYDARMNSVYGVDYDNNRIQTITADFYKQAREEGTVLNSFARSWTRRLAYFATASYSYKGRYTINLTGRMDGNNNMGHNSSSRWLPTGNVSGSWNAFEEPWVSKYFEAHNNWLSHALLRMSYSVVGDQITESNASPIFYARNIWRPQGDQQETGIALSQLGNSELTYEKKREFNLGVELGFLRNRINLVSDIYWRRNYDLMGYINTEGAGGEIRKFANDAAMKSHGIEATLSTKNLQLKDFSWTTDFTYAYSKTTITDLISQATVMDLIRNSGSNILLGYPHRSLFSIPFVGLNDEGIPQVINEKNQVTTSDINFQEYENIKYLKYEGSAEPTMQGGLNNTITWKNWRLNVFITYSFGNKVRLDPVFAARYSDMTAMPREFKNRWVMPGDENRTNIPAIASVRQYYNDNTLSYAYNAYNYSTARIADGGFIRMKDISLTYDLPKLFLTNIGLGSASLKIDATNLFLIYADDKLNGQDPEFVNSGGVASPLSRQFTLTLRLGL